MAAFYGVQPSPVDDSIWGQAMDVGFSRVDQPGYIIRMVPGRQSVGDGAGRSLPAAATAATARAGIDVDSNGVVWTALSSGHLASFDRQQVQGTAQRPGGRDRQALPRRLDALPVPGARSSRA